MTMDQISIVPELFWSLPGPRNFITRIEENAINSRILWINLPLQTLPGTWDGIRTGLRHGHINHVVVLKVGGGTDIAADVGAHFDRKSLTAAELISHHADQRSAIILLPDGQDGAVNGSRYATEFINSLGNGEGNVHLVVGGHEESITTDAKDGGIQVITFDGGLSPDEMDAYIALRMLSRPGPGSTRLTRAIVAEFAGFDVELAEQIMKLSETQIVNIKDNLHLLMTDSPFRWRHDSWLMRTQSSAAPGLSHTLNDQYLSEHGPEYGRESALNRIKQRYWRACVKTLTPWLEERRLDVIKTFWKQLQTEAAKNNGKIIKPIGKKFAEVDPASLEYNDIVGMSYTSKISSHSQAEICAENLCRIVKTVRDDIAHLRMPDPVQIQRMTLEMDRLLPNRVIG